MRRRRQLNGSVYKKKSTNNDERRHIICLSRIIRVCWNIALENSLFIFQLKRLFNAIYNETGTI